jgi:iron(II)-dependent oxidoreductase
MSRRTFLSLIISLVLFTTECAPAAPSDQVSSKDLTHHLAAIAGSAQSAPLTTIPAGPFLLGSKRTDGTPYGLWTQFDDTELPQNQVWLDTYEIDRDEVSLGEYLAFLKRRKQQPPEALTKLIWHLITVHAIPDQAMARWPALYVTWEEARNYCAAESKRLPTEAEWEKAARGPDGSLFPWGADAPDDRRAMFGQHHVHEIPIVAAVDSHQAGTSPYGLHHMAGNAAEWVQDWFGSDYYAYMPARNPPGPMSGRYKSLRGGSWKSKPTMLRTATRSGAPPDQRSATIGFRCAKSAPVSALESR